MISRWLRFVRGQAPEEFRNSEFIVEEGPLVAANAGMVNGKPHVFLTNFAGIASHRNVVPLRESAARVSVPASRKCMLEFLPFLEESEDNPWPARKRSVGV
jgi:hypothetical protein